MLLGEQSHRVDVGATNNLQVLVGLNVVVRQVCDVLETVHVQATGVHGGVGLGVVGQFLVFNLNALLLSFFLQDLVSALGADHADGDLLSGGRGGVGGTAACQAKD